MFRLVNVAAVLAFGAAAGLGGTAEPADGVTLLSSQGVECGTVRLPATGEIRPLYVVAGEVGCDEAGSVLNRYLSDPGLERAGNTQTAEFLGWICATPTAASARAYGYAISCLRGGDELQVL